MYLKQKNKNNKIYAKYKKQDDVISKYQVKIRELENRINQQNSAYENLKTKTDKLQREIDSKKIKIEELLVKNQQILGDENHEKAD